jgi:hypothetical protein
VKAEESTAAQARQAADRGFEMDAIKRPSALPCSKGYLDAANLDSIAASRASTVSKRYRASRRRDNWISADFPGHRRGAAGWLA